MAARQRGHVHAEEKGEVSYSAAKLLEEQRLAYSRSAFVKK